jgi:hypothetical protein
MSSTRLRVSELQRLVARCQRPSIPFYSSAERFKL